MEQILEIIHTDKIKFRGVLDYFILGKLDMDFRMMRVTMLIESLRFVRRARYKIDLFESNQIDRISTEIASIYDQEKSIIVNDLFKLTDLLDQHRDEQLKSASLLSKKHKSKSTHFQSDIILRLKEENMLLLLETNLSNQLQKLHIKNALLLTLCMNSWRSGYPIPLSLELSGILEEELVIYHQIQEINIQRKLNDKEAVSLLHIDNISHSKASEIRMDLSLVWLDREHTRKDPVMFRSSISKKHDKFFCLIKPEDSRKERFMDYFFQVPCQFNRANQDKQLTTEEEVHEGMLLALFDHLPETTVYVPHGEEIKIPVFQGDEFISHSIFLLLVCQITWLNQYQRKQDTIGRTISTKSDLMDAFTMLMLSGAYDKHDLTPNELSFYQTIQSFTAEKAIGRVFTQKDIRRHLRLSQSSCFRRIQALLNKEYITRIQVAKERKYYYKINNEEFHNPETEGLISAFRHQLDQLFIG